MKTPRIVRDARTVARLVVAAEATGAPGPDKLKAVKQEARRAIGLRCLVWLRGGIEVAVFLLGAVEDVHDLIERIERD